VLHTTDLADPTGGPYRLLHAFLGPMADAQPAALAPKKPWQKVRYPKLYVPGPRQTASAGSRGTGCRSTHPGSTKQRRTRSLFPKS
jgi:hypothetical protein